MKIIQQLADYLDQHGLLSQGMAGRLVQLGLIEELGTTTDGRHLTRGDGYYDDEKDEEYGDELREHSPRGQTKQRGHRARHRIGREQRARKPIRSVVVQTPKEMADLAKVKMVRIPAGELLMGSTKIEKTHNASEGPQHLVRFREGFWIGRYLITQEQWEAVMGHNPSHFRGARYLPVENVSWNDCQAFIRKLNYRGQGTFRLPSEAEWEYACRAGTATPFHTGKTISTSQANYDGKYAYGNGTIGVCRESTTPVGSFKRNSWGLYDVHGNVWEWCQDCFHDSYADAPVDGSAWESLDETCRVLRGGSWNDAPEFCRSACRKRAKPVTRNQTIGFRIVRI